MDSFQTKMQWCITTTITTTTKPTPTHKYTETPVLLVSSRDELVGTSQEIQLICRLAEHTGRRTEYILMCTRIRDQEAWSQVKQCCVYNATHS